MIANGEAALTMSRISGSGLGVQQSDGQGAVYAGQQYNVTIVLVDQWGNHINDANITASLGKALQSSKLQIVCSCIASSTEFSERCTYYAVRRTIQGEYVITYNITRSGPVDLLLLNNLTHQVSMGVGQLRQPLSNKTTCKHRLLYNAHSL